MLKEYSQVEGARRLGAVLGDISFRKNISETKYSHRNIN